jgi:hypothetical protein
MDVPETMAQDDEFGWQTHRPNRTLTTKVLCLRQYRLHKPKCIQYLRRHVPGTICPPPNIDSVSKLTIAGLEKSQQHTFLSFASMS